LGVSERVQNSSQPSRDIITTSTTTTTQNVSVLSQKGHVHLHPDSRDRRRLVQRCRLLKADILRFEATFRASSQGSGRDPKTVAEREPMADVYEEYRSLKHTIRDGAALHIQAVYRGYCTRRRLARLNNSKHGTNQQMTQLHSITSSSSIISDPSSVSSVVSGVIATNDSTKKPILAATSSSKPSTSASSSSSLLPSATHHLAPAPEMLKLSALRDEKAALKRKLRQFDIDFSANNEGRLPTKAEKEHLRPQYTRYHELKTIISETESKLGVKKEAESPTRDASLSRDSLSRRDGAGAPSTVLFGSHSEKVIGGTSGGGGGPVQSRSRSDSGSSTGHVGIDDDDDDESTPSLAGQKQDVQDKITLLKAEKKKLQVALREYEKDFLARNGRPVRYVKDISSVVQSYQRYKQLKQQLKELIS